MTTMEGERVKSTITGKVYEVRAIRNKSIILEALDGLSQVLTEKENLKLFYEKVENKNKLKDLTLIE